ncbi:substrate-binding domain-containing protein [Pinisolibacter aquiterrae]|uniref:substrate-binding domain-containing protein n=1 Tax=Pinisolibacter aquiterrae TaxID=2815579 RepID=UPI001C3C791C|nr:substrate-binding domain-containing protein [Pinisolibacter aquiterrae]MCC8236232.1 substrate-binding domain-containing protein [Pinisolibacter aquiterrae]
MTAVRAARTLLAAGLAVAGALLGGGGDGVAAERYAVVGPAAGSSFHEAVAAGCAARAATLDGATCVFLAPGRAETRSQGEIIAALTAEKIDGIAVSPALISEVLPAVAAARAAGLPVIAYDADLPADARDAFVGSDARDFGRALGASLRRWRPDGGLYAVLTGDSASRNLTERVAGVRDALGPSWHEIPASPVTTSTEPREAAAALDRVMSDHAELDAVISVGAWPFLDEARWREIAGRHKDRLDRAKVVLVVADALPVERALVRDGLGHVLVGQRPAEMGARIAEILTARRAGRRTPEIVYAGFDVLTRRDLLDDTK